MAGPENGGKDRKDTQDEKDKKDGAQAFPGLGRGLGHYNHPFCRAMRAASTRFSAPSLLIASDR